MARRRRAEVVVEDEIGVYHCIQRVVRRAFLCGQDPLSKKSYDHRKYWIRDRLEMLAGLFGIEIAAFAVMSNHVHIILRNRPDVVAVWADEEVARQWLTLFPGRVSLASHRASAPAQDSRVPAVALQTPAEGTQNVSQPEPQATSRQPVPPFDLAVKAMVANRALMKTIRERLSSLSWFMRALAEPIARRANREDECTGRFFEGRFRSQRLLDEAALLACSIYVDLNPIRAGLADRPETSEMTSVHERILGMIQASSSQSPRAAVPAEAPPAAEPLEVQAGTIDDAITPVIAGDIPLSEPPACPPTQAAASAGAGVARKAVVGSREAHDGWLSPIELDERAEPLMTALPAGPRGATLSTSARGRGRRASDRGLLPMTLRSYLELLDWTGRQLRAGARGAIPATLEAILVRLQVSSDSWLETVARFGRRFHGAVGLSEHVRQEAQRLGIHRLHGVRWSELAFTAPTAV